jgi:drug/metabolite transporter (DMT)-like permease
MHLSSELAAVGFGLIASLSWGTSDFSGGIAAKRAPIFAVMVFSYGIGLALLASLALFSGEPMAEPIDLIWGAVGGVSGGVGLTAQYRALSLGRMGINAPISALLSSMIPVVFAALTEGLPTTIQLAGFALALISVWFLARPSSVGDDHQGIGLAVAAGVGFGLFFILLGQVSDDAVFWPLASARGASFLFLLSMALLSRQGWSPRRAVIPIMLLAGLLDVGGNTFFLLSAQAGRLDVASVLSSLYPAVTVILARVLLHEHLTRLQTLGVILALLAVPLIAS